MKIAIVANTSWYVYNFRKELISELLKNGHQVVTVAPVYMDEYSQKLIDMGCTHFNVNMDNKGTNPVKDIATFFNFVSICTAQQEGERQEAKKRHFDVLMMNYRVSQGNNLRVTSFIPAWEFQNYCLYFYRKLQPWKM